MAELKRQYEQTAGKEENSQGNIEIGGSSPIYPIPRAAPTGRPPVTPPIRLPAAPPASPPATPPIRLPAAPPASPPATPPMRPPFRALSVTPDQLGETVPKLHRTDLAGVLHDSHLSKLKQNHRLNMREQYYQLEVLESLPLHVAVPTGDRCNIGCVFCTDRGPNTPYTDLNYDQFLEFTKPLEGATLVQLYGWGEPFINKEYDRMFDHVIERYPGIRIYISTNGVLLTDHWIDKLLSYGKCLINVSVNAATERTYAEVMQSTQFKRVIDNIQRLMKARKEREVHDLVVTLSFVAVKQNVHELPRFVELCGELNVNQIILQDMRLLEDHHRTDLFLGDSDSMARQYFEKAMDIAQSLGIYLDSFAHYPTKYFVQDRSKSTHLDLPRDCHAVWEQDDETLFYPQPGECYEPYMTFLVSQDGSVTTCCRSKEIMGNIRESSFEDIWNGEKYREYRRTINTFRPPLHCRECPVKAGGDVR